MPALGLNLVAFKASGPIDNPKNLNGPVVYVSADISYLNANESTFFNKSDAENLALRNKLMDFLISVSNTNDALFRSRMFAANANIAFTNGMVNDLFTAASGGTAPYLAPAAVAFSAANLISKSAFQQYSSAYLGGQTLPAIENQIIASRTAAIAALQQKKTLAYSDYNFFALKTDIDYLDSISSLNYGLAQLNSSAQKASEAASLIAATGTNAPSASTPVVTSAPISAQVTALQAGATLQTPASKKP